MKLAFCLLFFWISSSSLYACSAAYQYSLFPLGMSMGQLVVLELDLERYVQNPENKMMQFGGGIRNRFEVETNENQAIEVRWKGTIKLYQLVGQKMTLLEDYGNTDLSDKLYQEALQPFFLEALERAQQLPLFEEAVLENQGICHYDRSCTFMTKVLDKDNLKFYCISQEEGYQQDSALVNYPYKILLKSETQLKTKFTQMDSLDNQLQIDFFMIWSPQTVRRYRIGNQMVQVFTLGKGTKSKYTLKKCDTWEKIMLENIAHFIQGNDVIYHGQRFDFLQVL